MARIIGGVIRLDECNSMWDHRTGKCRCWEAQRQRDREYEARIPRGPAVPKPSDDRRLDDYADAPGLEACKTFAEIRRYTDSLPVTIERVREALGLNECENTPPVKTIRVFLEDGFMAEYHVPDRHIFITNKFGITEKFWPKTRTVNGSKEIEGIRFLSQLQDVKIAAYEYRTRIVDTGEETGAFEEPWVVAQIFGSWLQRCAVALLPKDNIPTIEVTLW